MKSKKTICFGVLAGIGAIAAVATPVLAADESCPLQGPENYCDSTSVTGTRPKFVMSMSSYIRWLMKDPTSNVGFRRNGYEARTQSSDADEDPCANENPGSESNVAGNPIVFSTGNKIEFERDFVADGEFPLGFARTYNHYWQGTGLLGPNWLTNLDFSLTRGTTFNGMDTIWIQKPDGRRIRFNRVGSTNEWREVKAASVARVVRNPDGSYTHFTEDYTREHYNMQGFITKLEQVSGVAWTFMYVDHRLQQVTHTNGSSILLAWNDGRLVTVTDPSGAAYRFSYNANLTGPGRSRLATATLPGEPATVVSYHYEDARFDGALTGKSYQGVRYSTFGYDSAGRATLSKHAGDVDQHTFVYTTTPYAPPPAAPRPPRPGQGGTCNAQGICFNPQGTLDPGKKDDGTLQLATAPPAASAAAIVSSVSHTAPSGKVTTYLFENGRRVGTDEQASTHCPAAARATNYDANGYPSVSEDFRGIKTKYVYNAKGQLLERYDAFGSVDQRRTSYVWNASSNLLEKITVDGLNESSFQYNPDFTPSSTSVRNLSASGVANQTLTTTYSYTKHANGLLASATEDGPLAGNVDARTMEFDASGRLATIRNALRVLNTFGNFDGNGRARAVVGANGESASLTYDGRGRLVRTVRTSGPTIASEDRSFGSSGLLLDRRSSDGVLQIYGYDAARRRVTTHDLRQDGQFDASEITYDAASRPTAVRVGTAATPAGVHVLGSVDGVSQNAAGDHVVSGWACAKYRDQPIPVGLYAGGPSGAGTYIGSATASIGGEPEIGRICATTGSAHRYAIVVSAATVVQHAGAAIYVQGISPVGGNNNILPDSGLHFLPGAAPQAAPTQAATCPANACNEWEAPAAAPTNVRFSTFTDYDELGRARAIRGNDGQNRRLTYDAVGNLVKERLSDDREWTFTYDDLNRLKTRTNPLLEVAQFRYDLADRLVYAKDERGLVSQFDYDGLGLLRGSSNPDAGSKSYVYHTHGRLQGETRNDGSTLSYAYGDALGRLTQITASTGEIRRFTYDACVNGLERLCTAEALDSAAAGVHTATEFQYSPDGAVTLKSSQAGTLTHSTGFQHDGFGRLSAVTYPDGMRVDYEYGRGRLAEVRSEFGGVSKVLATQFIHGPGGVIDSWVYGNALKRTYTYDDDARLMGIGVSSTQNVVQSLTYGHDVNDQVSALTNAIPSLVSGTYSYDAVGRLEQWPSSTASTTADSYDSGGNLILRTVAQAAPESHTFHVSPSSNRLEAISGSSVVAYTHTGRGHRATATQGGITSTYGYDAFDRISTVSRTGGATTRYYTDAIGQRSRKTTPGSSRYYVYGDASSLLAEYTPGAGRHDGWRNHVWIGGELIALVTRSATSFVHGDHLGRPEIATNTSGGVSWRARNTAFGRTVTLDNVGGISVGFPGQAWDPEANLWHNVNRDYDPSTGRYLQTDPVGILAGLNTYTYVVGNPVNSVDPLGLRGLVVRPAPPTSVQNSNPNQLRLPLTWSPGPQPAPQLYFSNYHQFSRPTAYAESMKRQAWSEADALSVLSEAFGQIFGSSVQSDEGCAVKVCGPGVGDVSSTACPNPNGRPTTGFVGPEGPRFGCTCL